MRQPHPNHDKSMTQNQMPESPQPVAETESLVGVASTDLFGWIPVSEQRPPLTEETPETNGFFLLLRHNPSRDAAGQYRMHLWFGSVPIDSTHWARIPSLPNIKDQAQPKDQNQQ